MNVSAKPAPGGIAAAPKGGPIDTEPSRAVEGAAPGKPLPGAAARALAEAAARREEADRNTAMANPPPELNGRGGLDPARYLDWEVAGRAVDF